MRITSKVVFLAVLSLLLISGCTSTKKTANTKPVAPVEQTEQKTEKSYAGFLAMIEIMKSTSKMPVGLASSTQTYIQQEGLTVDTAGKDVSTAGKLYFVKAIAVAKDLHTSEKVKNLISIGKLQQEDIHVIINNMTETLTKMTDKSSDEIRKALTQF